MTRRASFIALAAVLLLGSQAFGEDSLPSGLDAAVSKGLAFLAKQQDRNGSFDNDGRAVATTGLSVLAFLSTGNVPDMGRYGLNVRNGIDWLLARQSGDGFFGSGEHGMYSHAIATLALAEAQGVESSPERQARIRAALLKAVAVILAAQEAPKSQPAQAGGWAADRNGRESDLFLTTWNLLALRAADDTGIPVPERVFARAVSFISACYDAAGGGFAPQAGQKAQLGATAVGMFSLHLLGRADQNPAITESCTKYLRAHAVDANTPFAYHAAYFVTQATFQQGGSAWSDAGRGLLELLIKVQQPDGGWPQSKTAQEQGRAYATAMAIQGLAVPYRLLPINQR